MGGVPPRDRATLLYSYKVITPPRKRQAGWAERDELAAQRDNLTLNGDPRHRPMLLKRKELGTALVLADSQFLVLVILSEVRRRSRRRQSKDLLFVVPEPPIRRRQKAGPSTPAEAVGWDGNLNKTPASEFQRPTPSSTGRRRPAVARGGPAHDSRTRARSPRWIAAGSRKPE